MSKMTGLQLLRTNRSYRLFWTSHGVSVMGDSFSRLAVLMAVSALSDNDPALVALAAAALALPQMIASLLGGSLVDRYNRRRVLMISEAMAGVVTLGCAVAYYFRSMGAVFACLILSATIFGILPSTKLALVRQLVPQENLFVANSLSRINLVLAMGLGPPLAGVLIDRVGIEAAFVFDAATFAVAVLILWRMAAPPSPASNDRSWFRNLRAGVGYVVRHKLLVRLYALVVLPLYLFAGMNVAVQVPYLLGRYELDGSTVGLVFTAYAAGNVIGGVFSTMGKLDRFPLHKLLLFIMVYQGLAQVGKGLAPHYLIYMAINAAQGLVMVPAMSASSTLVQRTVSDEFIGRAGAAVAFGETSSLAVGHALVPVFVGWLGMAGIFIQSGVLTLVIWLVAMLLVWPLAAPTGADAPRAPAEADGPVDG